MDKETAIGKLMVFKSELSLLESFKGKAALIKDIDQKVKFLIKFKSTDNIPDLFVKDINDRLASIRPKNKEALK